MYYRKLPFFERGISAKKAGEASPFRHLSIIISGDLRTSELRGQQISDEPAPPGAMRLCMLALLPAMVLLPLAT